MKFFRADWAGGTVELEGKRLKPQKAGSVYILEAHAKHRVSLVGLGWRVLCAPVGVSGKPATAAHGPTTQNAASGPSRAAMALSGNARTVARAVKAGKMDELLVEMLDLEKAKTSGKRVTVISVIERRIEAIST
jgi:hypothetical protein